MANPTPTMPDLFKSWKEMYQQFESTWSSSVQEMLESEAFTQSLSLQREQYVKGQKLSRETLESHWEAMRIPTKSDVARVAAQIVSVENKVEELSDLLEGAEQRMARMEAMLEVLVGRVSAAKPQVAASAKVPTASARRKTKP